MTWMIAMNVLATASRGQMNRAHEQQKDSFQNSEPGIFLEVPLLAALALDLGVVFRRS